MHFCLLPNTVVLSTTNSVPLTSVQYNIPSLRHNHAVRDCRKRNIIILQIYHDAQLSGPTIMLDMFENELFFSLLYEPLSIYYYTYLMILIFN